MKELFNKIKDFYNKISDVVAPTAVLAIICIVVTLALSSANALTHKKIENLAIENQNKAMAKLIVADEYKEMAFKIEDSGSLIKYNTAVKNGETIGLILTVSAKGYGGDIQVMTAVNMDGSIAAIEILDASGETPGLGQNVTNPDWFAQFTGLKDNITVIKGGSANDDNNEVNAVTGATISSRAVTTAVNTALDYAAEILAKGDELK